MLNFRNFTLGGWWKVQFLDDLDQKCVLHLQVLLNCTLFRISVTSLGDLLDFGQLFKAFGNI